MATQSKAECSQTGHIDMIYCSCDPDPMTLIYKLDLKILKL